MVRQGLQLSFGRKALNVIGQNIKPLCLTGLRWIFIWSFVDQNWLYPNLIIKHHGNLFILTGLNLSHTIIQCQRFCQVGSQSSLHAKNCAQRWCTSRRRSWRQSMFSGQSKFSLKEEYPFFNLFWNCHYLCFFVFRFPKQRRRSVNKNYALDRYKEHWFKTKEGRFYTPNSTQDRTLWNNRKRRVLR